MTIMGNIADVTINSVAITNGEFKYNWKVDTIRSMVVLTVNKNSTATIDFNVTHYNPGNVKSITWYYLSYRI